MEKATFDAYVEFAGLMLVLVREEWGETLADGWVYGYVHDEERREALLLELIVCSEEVKEAWDSLSLIAQGLLLERKPLPHELADWLVQALEGTRRQPKSRGKDPYANFFRNSAIVLAVSFLSRERIKATRNGGGPPECCYEGGSACDAVGLAVAEIYEEPRSYKNIEYIWTESASPDSHLYRFGPSRCPIVRHPTCVLSTPAKSRGRHAPDAVAPSWNTRDLS